MSHPEETRITPPAPARPTIPGPGSMLRSSVPIRILSIAVLALSLQIPISMINGTIWERRMHRDQAIENVTGSWGGRQVLRGPMLVVPYVRRWSEKTEAADGTVKITQHQAVHTRYVLPETLRIDGRLDSEIRKRGIFDISLYVTSLAFEGSLRLPQLADFPEDTAEVHWDRMTLAVGLGDPRSIRDEASLEWNGQAVILEPGVTGVDLLDAGIHAGVSADAAQAAGSLVPFTIRLALAGSDGLQLLPAGSDTHVRITSNWPSPSFEGAYLPIARTVTADGFEATWKVLRLARGFPAAWESGTVKAKELDASLIGLRFVSPVDAYSTTERAVKYEMLFIFLTFGALFLVEVLANRRVHPVQYLLIGFALCLFYLLLLSLAEHAGFDVAYMAAATAITLLVAGYGRAALGSRGRAAAVGALVAALYVYLFVLLQIEDFALLIGSIGLFVALALVMFLTRRIDWYGLDVSLGRTVAATRIEGEEALAKP